MTNQVATVERQTLKTLIAAPQYQQRFQEILGKRTPQFVSSVLSVGQMLGADCDPTSIIASAMTAATLDLPVDKNLGFAWIVPYKKSGVKLGQFQMGYKGYIQLALRTGQYKRMNARVINKEAFKGWDEVGEPVIDWSLVDEAQPAEGYAFAFQLVNGFTKVAYWPKARVEEHAKRYSQSFRGGFDSPWKSNFDQMALKTVVKNELAKWGIMSIEMQSAFRHDQAVKRSPDDEPEFVDGSPAIEKPVFGKEVTEPAKEEPKSAKKTSKKKEPDPSPLDVPAPDAQRKETPDAPAQPESVKQAVLRKIEEVGYKPEQVIEVAIERVWIEPHHNFENMTEAKLGEFIEHWPAVVDLLKAKFPKQ